MNGNGSLTNRRPTFLGIGAARSATTWLHTMLKRHSGIYLPPVKEIHYFDRSPQYASPNLADREKCRWWLRVRNDYLETTDEVARCWYSNYLFSDYDDQWYVSLFENAEEGLPCGEITPAYSMLEVPDVREVHSINPEIKIIFQIRNPVERAWSGLLHSLKIQGKNLDEMDETFIKKELTSTGSRARTNYLRTIENWTSVFPESQMMIVYYEEVINDPENLIRKIVKFIGGDEHPDCSNLMYKKLNSSPGTVFPAEYKKILRCLYAEQLQDLHAKLDTQITKTWLLE